MALWSAFSLLSCPCHVLTFLQTDVSSTKVRSSNNPDELKQWLHPDVLKYIQDHKMYGFKDAELAAQAK